MIKYLEYTVPISKCNYRIISNGPHKEYHTSRCPDLRLCSPLLPECNKLRMGLVSYRENLPGISIIKSYFKVTYML